MLRIPVPPFSYYTVRGADRIEWLQGQLTQDAAGLGVGKWKRAAILSATGQIAADGAIWVFGNEVILGLDRFAAGVAESLADRIIMEDVTVEPIEGEVVSLVDGSASGKYVLPVDHVGTDGYDVIAPAQSIDADLIDYDTARIEAAVPLAGIDYDSKSLAMELGQHFIATRIAFGKGCYTGQEIVERIRSRGHTNKQWVGLRSDAEFSGYEGVRVTSKAVSPNFGHIALAYVPAALAVSGTAIADATVVELPFA